jgi:hypothetical protein
VKISELEGTDGFVGQGLNKSPYQEMTELVDINDRIIMDQDYKIRDLEEALRKQVRRADDAYNLLLHVSMAEEVSVQLHERIEKHLADWEGSA